MKGFLFKTGFRADFPQHRQLDRGGDHRICKFGSKSIGFDKVFIKVLARSPNLEIRAQDSNLRPPSPGIQPRNPSPGLQTQEIKPRNEFYGIRLESDASDPSPGPMKIVQLGRLESEIRILKSYDLKTQLLRHPPS